MTSPAVLRIAGYQDFSIQYEIRYFLRGYEEYRAIEGEIHRLIWYHFRRHGIEIPFPVRNVYLHNADGADSPLEASGSRLLRAWLLRPLIALDPIRDRLDAVEELAFRTTDRGKFRDGMTSSPRNTTSPSRTAESPAFRACPCPRFS